MITEDHSQIVDYIIASEKHKDGTDHLHVYLKMNKKLNIKSQKFFDLLDPKDLDNPEEVYHGNYQGCRSDMAVMNYVVKGGNYISSLSEADLDQKKKARGCKKAMIGEILLTDGLTASVIRDNPDLMLKDLTKLKQNVDMYTLLKQKEEESSRALKLSELDFSIPVNQHFRGIDITKKNCHLWIHGPRNTGKSYIIEQLIE